ncbi:MULTISPECIES: hypothetical protein [unclassified Variovorax]|uniref:hypothetical protein n=1 Tax=unclassified Variovorax TaxID=663243 RepID=UPI0013178D24|nr:MULTISPECIES: hypothetical protein [unclassified Variovorax]VTU42194.1 hypothetical protein H6P1_00127 [Variovorax sp. PBL-H6]VTU44179.1 hypothetical protein SRS16P1_00775 [Variovorax sp. SRS16]VTU44260.1 hypothetical protein E5P1_00768 [Variovorax sp. PBL-E5]
MSPTALNYSTTAIEELEARVPGLRGNGFTTTAAVHEQLGQLLREAVKFNLPEHGELVALENSTDSFSEFIRLPFDAVALEAPFPQDKEVYAGGGAFQETASSRRIAACWSSSLAKRYPALCPTGMSRPGFFVASVYYHDDAKRWLVAPLASFIPLNPGIWRGAEEPLPGSDQLEREFLLSQGRLKPTTATYECQTVNLCPEMVALMAQETGSMEQAIARLSIDVRDEASTALGFCLTVNASNVGRVRMPAPDKLNKKRIKNGRPPFYESWVLDLMKAPAGPARAGGYEIDGQRNPPRQHLRRGHIRRLAPDRITFVRPTTIGAGARGVVDKVYRL